MINQITKTLPRSEWQKVVIQENNEPLVEMKETDRLKIGLVSKSYKPSFFVRKSIAEKLYRISENLPEGIHLVLIEGYRSIQSQQLIWDTKFQKLTEENPTRSNEDIEKQVRLVVAKPAPLANHHCGGAIDVTLAYSDGTLLDMGTPYPSMISHSDFNSDLLPNVPMFSEKINWEQNKNRQILRNAMETQDFVWYPGEWWHYCWGDRMWAVYSNQTECFYGPAYLPIPFVKFLKREEINATPIQECGEPLVDIPITERILHRQGDGAKWLVAKLRKSVLEMLMKAGDMLPNGYKLVVMSAYIPVSMQQKVWDRKLEKLRLEHADWSKEKLLEEVPKYAARPTKGAPHNTGGSVDVVVLDQNGNELDMGSPFGGVGKPAHTRFAELTEVQIQNRQLLYWTMVNAGFINTNPFEWWHYAYGDRAYAAYKGEPFAIYDGIEE